MAKKKNYYVMFIDDRPISVYGPYTLKIAKDFARIGSQYGTSRRLVTRGLNGDPVRLYQKGYRRWPRGGVEIEGAGLTPGELPNDQKPYLPENLEKVWQDQPIGWLVEDITVDLSGLGGSK
jgi:hypothetical protein